MKRVLNPLALAVGGALVAFVGAAAAGEVASKDEAVSMVKKGVEKHARENNVSVITIELMEELRKKRFGNDMPVFKF